MPMTSADFDDERELQDWVSNHIEGFFGDCLLLPGFQVTTPTGKKGIPDGFAFNFSRRTWWIIECELLSHGVWRHMAEQFARYVVASRHDQTRRTIRKKVWQAVQDQDLLSSVAEALDTDVTHLHEQLESFLEGVEPTLAVFIDNTDQDLEDLCSALTATTEIYRVKKMIVNGEKEYFSPDANSPVVVTSPDQNNQAGSAVFDVAQQLGGELIDRRSKVYRLQDGCVAKLQYSKFHDRHQAYWYGIAQPGYEQAVEAGCTHIAFIMATDGFALIPISVLDKHLETAYVSKHSDGSIRHHHVYLTSPPDVTMKGGPGAGDIDVSEWFQALN